MLAKQDSLHDINFGQRETLIIQFDTSVTQMWREWEISVTRLQRTRIKSQFKPTSMTEISQSLSQIKQTFSRDWNLWWLDVAVIFTLCLHPPNLPSDYYAVGAQPVA